MSDPIELLEKRISEILEGAQTTAGMQFFCQVGGRYDNSGITTLQVSGSGWAVVSWRREDETLMYSYQLASQDMIRIYTMLLKLPFWRASPKKRSADENETNFHLRISDQTAGTSNGIQFWKSDMEQFAVLSQLMERLSSLIVVLSEGELEDICA